MDCKDGGREHCEIKSSYDAYSIVSQNQIRHYLKANGEPKSNEIKKSKKEKDIYKQINLRDFEDDGKVG